MCEVGVDSRSTNWGGNSNEVRGVGEEVLDVFGLGDKKAVRGDHVSVAEFERFGVCFLDDDIVLFALEEREDEGVASVEVDGAGSTGGGQDEGPGFVGGTAEEKDSSPLFVGKEE